MRHRRGHLPELRGVLADDLRGARVGRGVACFNKPSAHQILRPSPGGEPDGAGLALLQGKPGGGSQRGRAAVARREP